MKNRDQIINETYETNPKFKAQVEVYGLSLDDVVVEFLPEGERIVVGMDGKALTLGCSTQDKKVVSCFTDFTHEKICAAL